MEAIAVYGVSNNMSIVIYDINDDEVVAGYNNESPETYEISYDMIDDLEDDEIPYFKFGEIIVPLSQCMRI